MAKGKDTCKFIIKGGDFELDDMIPVREHMDGRFSYNLKNDVVASSDGGGGSYYQSEYEFECLVPILTMGSGKSYDGIKSVVSNPKSAYRKYMPFENIAPFRDEFFCPSLQDNDEVPNEVDYFIGLFYSIGR